MCQWLSVAVFHHHIKRYQEGTFTLFRVPSTIWKLYLFIYLFVTFCYQIDLRGGHFDGYKFNKESQKQILIVLCIYVKCEINLWILYFIVTDSVIFTPHSINLIPHLKQTVGQLIVLEKTTNGSYSHRLAHCFWFYSYQSYSLVIHLCSEVSFSRPSFTLLWSIDVLG